MFVVDISNIPANIQDFPAGAVEATILSAKMDVSKEKGNPLIRLEWEVYHPAVGTAILKNDTLPSAFPAKVKAFWQALNAFTNEDMADQPEAQIDPDALVGAQLILQIGPKESSNGKVYTSVLTPWYYPITRTDVLSYEGADLPL